MKYTNGYDETVVRFMERRRIDTHGAFALSLVRPESRILDMGCGPGTITVGFAGLAREGFVLGVDQERSQIGIACARARELKLENAAFEVASAMDFKWEGEPFDLIFSHALMEHVEQHVSLLRTWRSLLKPYGRVALRSPDWGGWVLYPETDDVKFAIEAFEQIQKSNGGDTHAGRKLGNWLREAGYDEIAVRGSYEVYPSARLPAEFIAIQLERAGEVRHATAMRDWAGHPDSLFAQSWFEAVGRARQA